jgi:hypothetical protein
MRLAYGRPRPGCRVRRNRSSAVRAAARVRRARAARHPRQQSGERHSLGNAVGFQQRPRTPGRQRAGDRRRLHAAVRWAPRQRRDATPTIRLARRQRRGAHRAHRAAGRRTHRAWRAARTLVADIDQRRPAHGDARARRNRTASPVSAPRSARLDRRQRRTGGAGGGEAHTAARCRGGRRAFRVADTGRRQLLFAGRARSTAGMRHRVRRPRRTPGGLPARLHSRGATPTMASWRSAGARSCAARSATP